MTGPASKSEKSSFEFAGIAILILLIGLSQLVFPLNLTGVLIWIVAVSFVLFFFLAVERSVDIIFVFYSLIFSFSLYTFTAFPGRASIQKQYFLILAFLYVVMFFYVKLYSSESSKRVVSYSRNELTLIIISLLFLLISYFYFNQQDAFKISGISKLILMILAPYLFGIVLPTKLLENEVNLNVFLKSFVYLGILSGLGGFVTMFFDVNPWSPKGVATSFYGHQNGTSSVYNYTLPAALYFVLFRREVLNKVEKFLFSSGVMIMIIALLYTFSRAGIVSIALILVIASIKYSKKLFYIIIASAPIFFIFLVQGIFTSKGADTALARIGLLAVTIDMLKAKLLWGYGIISTITTFERLKLALNVYDQNNTPHNIILFLILQIGLFAVLPLVLVMISVLWKSTKLIFEKSTDPLLIISYCVCFSMIFKNMFEDLLVYPEFFMYHIFWVFWGFILFFNSGKESKYFPKQF